MIKKILIIKIINLSCLLYSMNIEGFYESQIGRTQESDSFDWNIWDSNFYLETRMFGNPNNNTSYYIKFYPYKDYNDSFRSLAVMSESNISFRDEINGYGFNSILFFRESQHYWLDGSMLNLLNTGIVNNDGNGQGARLDMWHKFNGSMTYVFSDFSQGDSDDIHLMRYRQSFLNEKVNTGFYMLRKNYSSGISNEYNQVIASDLKLFFGRYFLNTEIAVSKVPSDGSIEILNNNYDKDEIFKSNIAFQTELRGLRLGAPKLGYWFINPGFFSFGNTYRNYLGDNQSNKYGYWINTYYLVPERAVTLVMNYSFYEKIIPDTISLDYTSEKMITNPITNLYTEIYIEFINGFKGKVSFNKKDEFWQGQYYKHYDILSELSVENYLAKLLAQYKIKDFGEIWEKQITGVELSVNLTEQWKFFTRGMIVNDRVGSRYSFFTEFQYRTSGNTELYLQYGPNYLGQYGLTNDDGFASSGSMIKELKIILKGWF